ncbi:MAG: hypothetical protein ACRCY5_05105, partial [Phocaeicola sp.]
MKNKVTKDDLKGEIKDFPIEVVQRMCECQVEQGNEFDPIIFANKKVANAFNNGFGWNGTNEGFSFWGGVINGKNFDSFFEKYPKKNNETKVNNNNMIAKVTKEDLKGEIKDFPIEVVQRMCECQVEQGNKFCPYEFEIYAASGVEDSGFDWADTSEGPCFWGKAIEDKNFELFFEKYPREAEQKQETKMETEFKIPDGYEFDCVENGVIKLKAVKKELPKTWEECIEVGNTYYYISTTSAIEKAKIEEDEHLPSNRNLMTSNKTAEAMRAFTMLITARDVYRNGCIPDWANEKIKYCIVIRKNKIEIGNFTYCSVPLSFQSEEVRDAFLEN